jgi:hypothetical protein
VSRWWCGVNVDEKKKKSDEEAKKKRGEDRREKSDTCLFHTPPLLKLDGGK